jgi:glycine/D-amino acid oxidase-like deaminating enzyme
LAKKATTALRAGLARISARTRASSAGASPGSGLHWSCEGASRSSGRPGRSDVCGGGASGRNSGFFSPWWHAIEELALSYGEEPAIRYATSVADGITAAEDFRRRHDIDAHLHRDGIVYLSTTEEPSRGLAAGAGAGAGGRAYLYG